MLSWCELLKVHHQWEGAGWESTLQSTCIITLMLMLVYMMLILVQMIIFYLCLGVEREEDALGRGKGTAGSVLHLHHKIIIRVVMIILGKVLL